MRLPFAELSHISEDIIWCQGAPAAPKKLTAAETRSLSWLVWAHDILHLPTCGVRWEADTLVAAARGLAAHTPYAVRLTDVAVEVRPFIHEAYSVLSYRQLSQRGYSTWHVMCECACVQLCISSCYCELAMPAVFLMTLLLKALRLFD